MKAFATGLILLAASSSFASPKHRSDTATRQDAINTAFMNQLSVQNDFWFDNGDFPRVIELFRFAYELEPSDYEIATNLGWMLENVENYGEALVTYQRFRRENPKDPDAAFPEANFYFFHKAYNKVPPILEPTIKHRPQPNNYRVLAHSYDRMGMVVDCVRVWNLYVKDYPGDLKGIANLKRAKEKLQKSGGARR